MNKYRPKLYLAAPLFSSAEKVFNLELTAKLEPWFEVFLPQRDGGLIADLMKKEPNLQPSFVASRIFTYDMAAVESCDTLLIVLDGRAIDEGAAFEFGVGYTLRKFCQGLQTDSRRLNLYGNNPIIEAALSNRIFNPSSLVDPTFDWWLGKYYQQVLDHMVKDGSCINVFGPTLTNEEVPQ